MAGTGLKRERNGKELDMETKTKTKGPNNASATLSKVAIGQLIQVATGQGRHNVSDISPGALAELAQAGMVEQRAPEIPADRTLEAQIQKNREALAIVAHWAKTACPKDPFKGSIKGQGWNGIRHHEHPAYTAFNQIQKPQEYRACSVTVISQKGWDFLAGLGITKPSKEDEGKPCVR